MLPHIRRRPISMVRAPDGINGQQFFQRHVLAGVAAVKPLKARGVKKPFHAIDSVEGLVALAQAAVLEIHPWGCKENDPETPERIIIDLDPDPELPFDRVIDGAKEVRDALALCGFTPFVKTTGGKGIHVVVAIKGTPKKPAALAGREGLRACAGGAGGGGRARALHDQHVEDEARREDLPRLSAQRPHGHRDRRHGRRARGRAPPSRRRSRGRICARDSIRRRSRSRPRRRC